MPGRIRLPEPIERRIARWRHAQALARTIRDRPDLIEARGGLSPADEQLLAEFDLP